LIRLKTKLFLSFGPAQIGLEGSFPTCVSDESKNSYHRRRKELWKTGMAEIEKISANRIWAQFSTF